MKLSITSLGLLALAVIPAQAENIVITAHSYGQFKGYSKAVTVGLGRCYKPSAEFRLRSISVPAGHNCYVFGNPDCTFADHFWTGPWGAPGMDLWTQQGWATSVKCSAGDGPPPVDKVVPTKLAGFPSGKTGLPDFDRDGN